MKILTADQVRAADSHTIENEPISSIDLMERAAVAFTESFLTLPLSPLPVLIICGPGNNGGDGLAIARLLSERNYQVEVWLIRLGADLSEDCSTNLTRWQRIGKVVEIHQSGQLPAPDNQKVIIDALFGSGINRGITGLAAEVINYINQCKCQVVAVDMPSGLFADRPSPGDGAITKAQYTLSFQVPKLAFFLPENYQYVGTWKVVDIGLHQQFIQDQQSNYFTIDQNSLPKPSGPVSMFSHKGSFGHALLVTGSQGKMGAAILSSRAALRAGLGLLTVHIPACGYTALQTAVPEAMCSIDHQQQWISDIVDADNYKAIGVGPGIGQNPATVEAFSNLLKKCDCPMVIDADGLNILSAKPSLLEKLPGNSILTPHPGEFVRLVGAFTNDFQRLEMQQQFAKKYQVILICKGAFTTVALPNGAVYFNTTGNSGMATAGSGDVLTGLITGLLSRSANPVLAALAGVYIHGTAGDLAADEHTAVSMVAGDIIEHIGAAIRKLNLQL